MKKRNGSGLSESDFEKAGELNGQFTDVFTKNGHSQVPLLNRKAPFMEDIVVSKEGVTKLLKHYENMPMQYRGIFKVVKNENFQWKKFDIFLIFAQNIDCGYTLEPPRRGSSNEYPQSMFWSKNKKNRYTPTYPSFTI